MSNARLLVVKGAGGLGNRMLNVPSAMLYARITGRRMVMDWTDATYSGDRTNAFHRYFRSPWCDPAATIPETDSVAPAAWRGHLHESVEERLGALGDTRATRLALSTDVTRSDYEEDVLVTWFQATRIGLLRRHFRGPLRHLFWQPSRSIFTRMLREDLLLQPLIRERVQRFKAEQLGAPAVGIHVRYSDKRVDVRAIVKELDALLERRRGLRVFLATDSLEVKERFERDYPGVVSTPHWYPPAGVSAHESGAAPDRLEAGIEALVDLYLLAECEYLIADSRSTYARIATLLWGHHSRACLTCTAVGDV